MNDRIRLINDQSELWPILTIERSSYERPWSYQDFATVLSAGLGIYIESDKILSGYAIYVIGPDKLEIVNIAVTPELRRLKLGTKMVNHIKESYKGLPLITSVNENNLQGQLFFKSLGFKAGAIYNVLKNEILDSTSYLMYYDPTDN